MLTPNKLLDHVLDITEIKNDAALSHALLVSPSVLSKIRHSNMPVGSSLILKIHKLTGIPVAKIEEMVGA